MIVICHSDKYFIQIQDNKNIYNSGLLVTLSLVYISKCIPSKKINILNGGMKYTFMTFMTFLPSFH